MKKVLSFGRLGCVALLAGAALHCKGEQPERRPPPPPVKPAACRAEPRVNDPTNLKHFPAKAASFCLDPSGSDRGYGEGAKSPLGDICNLFDGECEIYLSGGAVRVVEAHYVDGDGSGATVDAYLSTYSSTEAAYAMFTKRIVGDGDPAHPDTPQPIAGGAAAGLGLGNAYLWRGQLLAEITYNDAAASVSQIQGRAAAVLGPLCAELGAKLPGKLELPPAAAALPSEQRLPLGIRFVAADVAGIPGTGAGATGYYRDGEKRWRVLSIVKDDVEQAKDVMITIAGIPGAAKEKALGDAALRIITQGAGDARTEWIIARAASRLVGVGDEARVLAEGMSIEQYRALTLDQDEKRALLRRLLSPKP